MYICRKPTRNIVSDMKNFFMFLELVVVSGC